MPVRTRCTIPCMHDTTLVARRRNETNRAEVKKKQKTQLKNKTSK
jgi:hypothetical protein